MRKFCAFGFFLGVALSSVLLAVSRLTGHSVWDDTNFGSYSRIFWPFASLLLIDIDVNLSQTAFLIVSVVSVGANGLLYASLGLAAYFVNRFIVRRAEVNSSRGIAEKKA
jgi:hypothetical protein